MNSLLGKLLVVGGRPASSGIKAEVIDVLNENSQCEDFPDVPYDTKTSHWGLIKGHIPIVCGGITETTSPFTFFDTCYVVGGDNSQLIQMVNQRYSGSHIVMPEGDKVRTILKLSTNY